MIEEINRRSARSWNRSTWKLPAGFIILTILTLVFVGSGVTAGTVDPSPEDVAFLEDNFEPGELLVKFSENVSAQAVEQAMAQVGATYVRHLYQNDVQLWQVAEGAVLSAVEMLNNMESIAYAEPNYIAMAADTIPNDPAYGNQWAHPVMRSPAGWDISVGSSDVVIAIIDTGIDLGHPDLAAKLVPGFDFVDNDSVPRDLNGHGTHVAGIAGAVTNNGVGIAGLDWLARIMPVRALNDQGTGSYDQIIDSVTFAYAQGADVINMSLGGFSYSQALQDAINAANANDALVVAAMGNYRDFGNPTNYPAAMSNVVAVSATNPNDQYSYYSQFGPHNDLSAPGGEMDNYQDPFGIYSTMPTYHVVLTTQYNYFRNYDYLQGTSQATPQVAGLAALIWSLSPGMEPDDVESLMKATAVDLGPPGWDTNYGYGRIDIANALAELAVPATPTLNEISNPDGDGSYNVSWNAVQNGDNYVLQTDTSPLFNAPTQVYNGPGTSTQVNNSAPGWHYYRVRAEGPAGSSGWSNIQSVVVAPDAPVLNPISNGSGDDAYSINWQAAAGALGYKLEEDDNPGFNSPVVRYIGQDTTYQVTGQPGGAWYYRVSGYNDAGYGDYSNTQSTMVDPAPLAAPTLSPINLTGTFSYTVEWSAVGSATDYILEESTNPYFVDPTVIYTGPDTSYMVTQQNGGTWYYRVRGDSPVGMSPWSNTEEISIVVTVYLPVLLKP